VSLAALRPVISDRSAEGKSVVGEALSVSVETLFRRYAPYVGAIALRTLGCREEADDLVQDVFVAAIDGVKRVRDPDAIKAWLVTVTLRLCRRRLRRRRLLTLLRLDEGVEYAAAVDLAAPPEMKLLVARVYRALDTVSVDRRIAWTLRYLHGESLAAVAAMCDCSLATAKRRISAASRAIQGVLRDG